MSPFDILVSIYAIVFSLFLVLVTIVITGKQTAVYKITKEEKWPSTKVRAVTLLNSKDLPLSKRQAVRVYALDYALKTAMIQYNVPENLLQIRDFSCIWDAELPLDEWETEPLMERGKEYSIFQSNKTLYLKHGRVVVFYAVGIEDTPSPISRISFREGVYGDIRYSFDLEHMGGQSFFEPIEFLPNRLYSIRVKSKVATCKPAHVRLFGFTVEPRGLEIRGF